MNISFKKCSSAAISQNANNVATNTNVGNEIGVVVLPIPGKRSVDFWRLMSKIPDADKCNLQDKVAGILFHRLTQLKELLNTFKDHPPCLSQGICNLISNTYENMLFDDALIVGGLKNPFLNMNSCQRIFPSCVR